MCRLAPGICIVSWARKFLFTFDIALLIVGFVCGILSTQQLGSYVLSTSGVNAVIAQRRQNHGNMFFSVYKIQS
jgi:hypothetical protein